MALNSEDPKTLKRQLLVCNCDNTMTIDAKKLGENLGLTETPEIHCNLCRSQLSSFENAIANNQHQGTIVTCTQEAPLFQDIASETDNADITFVNIRETAGWSKSGKKAKAKMAALIAQSAYDVTPTGLISIASKGVCIVYGSGQQAMDVATKLSSHLSVSLVLPNADDMLIPGSTQFPVYSGKIEKATGSMGKYEVTIRDYAGINPASKDHPSFQNTKSNAVVQSDLIFDLSGGSKLVGTNHDRDGYLHIDPSNQTQIAEAMFNIIDLVGEFEKPIFVSYDPSICAHSRSGQVGCSACIDNCPTSAISSKGDNIVVNNEICDGCGHCSAGCPTGAISYTFPNRTDIIGRCQTLLSTYLEAGGENPIILIHEEKHGQDLISAIARFGNGLAENVLPLSVHSITHIGHEIFSAFFTSGAQTVIALAPLKKRDELLALNLEIEITNTFLWGMEYPKGAEVQLLNEDDPDIVEEALANILKVKMPAPKNFTPSKNKRETSNLALANLNSIAPKTVEILDLPAQSPYGKITINTDSCTLCLACVGACPASALRDNEERPEVSFIEHNCVQCGLCQTTCPENAITLTAQYNFEPSALSPMVLNTEEPLECTECGKPFGSKAAIEKVIGILKDKNPMFQTSQQLALLKMCENCRVIVMSQNEKDPMTFGTVPKVMTADDYTEEDENPTKH